MTSGRNEAAAGACLSDFALDELWLRGDRADHPATAHLAACPACRARLEEYGQLRARFVRELFEPGLDEVVARVQAAPGRRPSGPARPWRWALVGTIAAGLALLGLFLYPWPHPAGEAYRGVKGFVGLEIRAGQGPDAERLFNGDPVVAGEALRFDVRLAQSAYLMVVIDDGAAPLRVVFPAGQGAARPVEAGHLRLEGSWVVPAGPGRVQVSAMISERPFGLDDVSAALAGRRLDATAPSVEALQARGISLVSLRLERAGP